MPNEFIMTDGVRREMTDAEQAALDASRAANAPAQAKASLIAQYDAALAANEINGQVVPLTMERISAFKGIAEEVAAGLFDGLYPVPLPIDGVVVEVASAAEVTALYKSMRGTFLQNRVALGHAIKAL